MIVFVPNLLNNFSAFQQPHSSRLVQEVIANTFVSRNYYMRPCNILFPKFSLEYKVPNMKEMLKSMGVHGIFEAGSKDFFPMTPSDQVYVSEVEHKAVIEVNEKGIKASASTGVGISERMSPENVIVNRPFVFFIRHRETGSILFLGRIVRPQS